MKVKHFALLSIGSIAIASMSAFAISALNKNNSVFGKATVAVPHSIVLTASDFTAGNGNFWRAGVEFAYNGVSIEGDLVTVSTNFFTTGASYSGKTKEDGLRGNGFTAIVMDDFAITGEAGDVVYLFDDVRGIKGSVGITESIDLTKGGTVESDYRVGFEMATGPRTFTFSKITIGYECVESVPHAVLSLSANSVGVGQTVTVTATPKELYGETATYSWDTADHSKATVVGNGTEATVTGVGVTDAVAVVCTMTVAGHEYESSINVQVVSSVTIKPIVFLNTNETTNIQGAGVYFYIDNSGDIGFPTSGATADYNSKITIDVEFKDNTGNYKGSESTLTSASIVNMRDCSASQVTVYATMAAGFPDGQDFTHHFTVTYQVNSSLKYVGEITFHGNTTIVNE